MVTNITVLAECPPQILTSRPQDETPPSMTPLDILVVDDDSLVLSSTSMMVEELGHRSVCALSAAEAMVLVEKQAFDLVITDFAMPGMTGAQLILALAVSHPDLRCMLATGYAVLPPGMPKGLVRLDKPFNEDRLKASIELAMRGGGKQDRA